MSTRNVCLCIPILDDKGKFSLFWGWGGWRWGFVGPGAARSLLGRIAFCSILFFPFHYYVHFLLPPKSSPVTSLPEFHPPFFSILLLLLLSLFFLLLFLFYPFLLFVFTAAKTPPINRAAFNPQSFSLGLSPFPLRPHFLAFTRTIRRIRRAKDLVRSPFPFFRTPNHSLIPIASLLWRDPSRKSFDGREPVHARVRGFSY